MQESIDSPDSLQALYRDGEANTIDECAFLMYAKNVAGQKCKVMSISSSWKGLVPDYEYNWVRYNATYFVNGVGYDDLQIQQFGGKGMTFFGGGGEPPEGIKLQNCGTYMGEELHRFNDGVALKNWSPGTAPIEGYARIRLSEGKLQVILSDGTVRTVKYE